MRSEDQAAPSAQVMSDRPGTCGTDSREVAFAARRSAVEPCLTWRLTQDSLLCERAAGPASRLAWLAAMPNDHWPARQPLAEIASIRLRFDPTRFADNRYRCDLRARNGARTSIFSTHYAGPGDFEDRAEDYAAFVSALTERTQRLNPSVRLVGGLSWPAYLFQHAFVLAALIALVTMLGIAGVPLLGSAWVKLAIVMTYAGVALRYARINVPKDFSLPPPKA